jgi:SWI/SNF-related matrix-associated actin-dependent regulator of chromatin subfamily A-like protein 1
MRIIKDKTYYVAVSNFEEKDIVKKAGFKWVPETYYNEKRVWWTPSRTTAAKLAEYADDGLKAELAEDHQAYATTMELSRGNGIANINIPHNPGWELYPYQRDGVAYSLPRFGTLIADDMGLGKTPTALSIINCLPWIDRVLVICPATLKRNWQIEAERWLTRPMSIGIADSKHDFPTTRMVIINYDIVHKFHDELRAVDWDLQICDEAHYLKAGKNRRSVHVLGGKAKLSTGTFNLEPIPGKKLIFMTGSPVENGKPRELYPLIKRLDPDFKENWKGWIYYHKTFCGAFQTRFGWDTSGASNLDLLQSKLRETIMVRRMKSQVLTDLPPKVRQVIELSPNGNTGCIKKEQEAWDRHEANMIALKADVELAKALDKEEYEAAVDRLQKGASAALTEISKLRHETALAKLPAVLEFLEGRSGKVVIFAHHLDVIDKLKEHFGNKAVVLTGKQSPEQKHEAVQRFQNDPEVEVFIGGIKAAGLGLTLVAASHVIFVELDWVPGVVSQAEDRCHRIGQKDSVLVQHLVYEGSIDAKVVRTLVAKQKLIDAALDDLQPDEPVTPGDEAATRRISRNRVEAISITLTEEQVAAIHTGLQSLAGVCDGALQKDEIGFNMLDTRIGKALAMSPALTPKQAALGQRLCIKYRRQLSADLITIIKGE